jgi:L-ascorbate metabolism protein UlaG (beta-lactamase superfamily)
MHCRWLGWAGVELEHDGQRVVIDPLADAAALYVAVPGAAASVTFPELAAPQSGALAGLVTHLHRDHADAGALTSALAPGAPVLGPYSPPIAGFQDAAIAQAAKELERAQLAVVSKREWETTEIGPFRITALPAADGTGDPQVSWAIEAGGRRVVHCGDTLFHGWWWRAAAVAGPFDAAFLPVNGAVLSFPWRVPPSPLPGAMTAEQAAVAGRSLGAVQLIPMHFGAFDLEPYYRSVPNAAELFATQAGASCTRLAVGETLEL